MMEVLPAALAPGRRRKVNFSAREVRVLLQEVERLRGPLLGIGLGGGPGRRGSRGGGARLSQQSVERAWGHVADCVSAVAPVRRQHRDVRKKWADLKWAALRAGDHGDATDAVSRYILRIIRGEASGLLAHEQQQHQHQQQQQHHMQQQMQQQQQRLQQQQHLQVEP